MCLTRGVIFSSVLIRWSLLRMLAIFFVYSKWSTMAFVENKIVGSPLGNNRFRLNSSSSIVMPIFIYAWRFSCNVKSKRVHFADDTELSLVGNSWEDLGVSVNGVQK